MSTCPSCRSPEQAEHARAGSLEPTHAIVAPADLRPGVYTVAQAAQRLGISPRTARRLLRDDDFPVPTIRLGTRRVVSVAVLERFLDGPDEDEMGERL